MSGGVLDAEKTATCYGQLISSTSSYLLKTVRINLILDRDKYCQMRYNSFGRNKEKDKRRVPGELTRLMYSGFKTEHSKLLALWFLRV